MHISATSFPAVADIRANIQRLADLGLQVNLSEMDVRIKDVAGDAATKPERQRQVYRDVVAACAAVPRCEAVTFWGFTDAHSWIDSAFGADDPLLFVDEQYPAPSRRSSASRTPSTGGQAIIRGSVRPAVHSPPGRNSMKGPRAFAVLSTALLFVAIFLPPPRASAQASATGLRGFVTDEQGQRLADVDVEIQFMGTPKRTYHVKTNKKGGFVRIGLVRTGPTRSSLTEDRLPEERDRLAWLSLGGLSDLCENLNPGPNEPCEEPHAGLWLHRWE